MPSPHTRGVFPPAAAHCGPTRRRPRTRVVPARSGVFICIALHYSAEVWEICWTEEAEEHISRHGVAPDEVEDVLYSRPRHTVRGRENTTLVYGQTADGRRLLVVLAEAMDGCWYVATARDLTSNERRLLDRKGR